MRWRRQVRSPTLSRWIRAVAAAPMAPAVAAMRAAAAAAPPMERAVPVAPSAVAAALPMDGAATAAPAAAAAACPASAVSTGGSKQLAREITRDPRDFGRGTEVVGRQLATGAELGEHVAGARCPGELAAGAGGTDALVENERVGKRAELGSRLLHRD